MSALTIGLGRTYLRWSARRRLDGIWVDGGERARAALARGPVVFAANHVSWWDGPLGVLADEATGAESRFLVDAANLAKVPFLRWFGAIDLDRSGLATARHGLRAACSWLDRPGRAVWIYPQGRQRPAHLRPLGISGGVDWLAARSGAVVVPVGISYGWREQHCPAAALSFGPPCGRSPEAVELALTHQLGVLDRFFDGREVLEPLVGPVGRRLQDGWGARALALFSGRTP